MARDASWSELRCQSSAGALLHDGSSIHLRNSPVAVHSLAQAVPHLSEWRGADRCVHLSQVEGDNEVSKSPFQPTPEKAAPHIRLSSEAEEMIAAWKSGRGAYETDDASTGSQANEQHPVQYEEPAGLMPQVRATLYVLEQH